VVLNETNVTGSGVAARLVRAVSDAAGAPFPLPLRAWDGSAAATKGASNSDPTVVVRSPKALQYCMWRPGELGLARAYVTGALDVDGDLRTALRVCWRFAHAARVPGPSVYSVLRRGFTTMSWLARIGGIGLPPIRPREEIRLPGRRHSRDGDRASISHHYDLGNDFYQLVLDQTMAYSCGYWTSSVASYGLVDAQRDKLELVCRQLGLRPGMRFLDVGCGWGSLMTHAAENHGVHASGVTLSARQSEFILAETHNRGLVDRIDVQNLDYRQVHGEYDAVASVEIGEHVGEANYPAYCRVLYDALSLTP
jgi:cyclopropane-fatty-acyl-phospholipid synthase